MREISPPSHHPAPGAGFLWALVGSESEERADVHRQGKGLPGSGPCVSAWEGCLLPGSALSQLPPMEGPAEPCWGLPWAGEDVRRCRSGPASAGQWDVLGSPIRGPAGQEVGRGIQVVTAEDSRDKKSGS